MTIKYYLKKSAKWLYRIGVRPWLKKFPHSLKINLVNDLIPPIANANAPVFTLPITNLSYVDQLRFAHIKELHIKEQQKNYSDFLMDQGLGVPSENASPAAFNEELPAVAFALRHINPGLAKTLVAGKPLKLLPHYLAYTTQHHIDILNEQVMFYDHPQMNVLPATSVHQAISQNKYHCVIYNFPVNTPFAQFHDVTQIFNDLLPPQTSCLLTANFKGDFYLTEIMPRFQELLQFFSGRFKLLEFSTSTFHSLTSHWQFNSLNLNTSLIHPNDQLTLLFAGKIT